MFAPTPFCLLWTKEVGFILPKYVPSFRASVGSLHDLAEVICKTNGTITKYQLET